MKFITNTFKKKKKNLFNLCTIGFFQSNGLVKYQIIDKLCFNPMF